MCGGDNTIGNFQNLQEKDQNSCNIELELIWWWVLKNQETEKKKFFFLASCQQHFEIEIFHFGFDTNFVDMFCVSFWPPHQHYIVLF